MSVRNRYFKDVLPMQKKYIELQKKWADVKVNGNRDFDDNSINKLVKNIGYGYNK
jgi:uridine kinase